jgi:hypothetical protein
MRVAAVDYVMVPVPEELAEKVLRYVTWMGRPSLSSTTNAEDGGSGVSGTGDADPTSGGRSIARALATLDDASRSLFAHISSAALDHDPLTVPEAARQAGLSQREVAGTIVEFNALIASEGGPGLTVFLTGLVGDESPDFTWGDSHIMMSEANARAVAELVRAVHQE